MGGKIDNSLVGISYPATRQLRDNELNAVVNALDRSGDKVLQRDELLVTSRDRFLRMDENRNNRLETSEAKGAFQRDELNITFQGARKPAVDVLLKMDSNQDGYLGQNELAMNQKMINQLDGYGARKYGAENGARVYDAKGKVRETGDARQDGAISISEMANALADGLLKIGSRITLPNRE